MILGIELEKDTVNLMKRPNLYLGISLAGWLAYSASATAQDGLSAELKESETVSSASPDTNLTLSYSEPLALPVSTAEAATLYGPIRRTDTLWDIAGQYTQDPTTVQQTMVALYHLNPSAFVRGNINYLQRGVSLRIPTTTQVHQRSAAEALSEFRRLTQQGSRNPSRGAVYVAPARSTAQEQSSLSLGINEPNSLAYTPVVESNPNALTATELAPTDETGADSKTARVESKSEVADLAAPEDESDRNPDARAEGAELASDTDANSKKVLTEDQANVVEPEISALEADNSLDVASTLVETTEQVSDTNADSQAERVESNSEVAESEVAKPETSAVESDSNPEPATRLTDTLELASETDANNNTVLPQTPAVDAASSPAADTLTNTEEPVLSKQEEELALVRLQLELMDELREQVTMSNQQLVTLADNNQALRQRLAHLSEQVDALQKANTKVTASNEPAPKEEWQQRLNNPLTLALLALVPVLLLVLLLMGRRRRRLKEASSEATTTPLTSAAATAELSDDKEAEHPHSAQVPSHPQVAPAKPKDTSETVEEPVATESTTLDLATDVGNEESDPAELEQDSALVAHLKEPYVSVEQLMAEAEQGLGPDPDRQPNMNVGLDEYADVLGTSAHRGIDIDADEGGIGAQLDLARAYIEIDDAKSARDLLNIALKQGNPEQQQEAQKLLQRLS